VADFTYSSGCYHLCNEYPSLPKNKKKSHAGILSPQQAWAHSRNQLDVVIAFCPVIANHGLDSLQREADISELMRAVPLELGCMEATHLTFKVFKVSATDCPNVGIGRRRGRQVKPL